MYFMAYRSKMKFDESGPQNPCYYVKYSNTCVNMSFCCIFDSILVPGRVCLEGEG